MAKAAAPYTLGMPVNEWLARSGTKAITSADFAPLIQPVVVVGDYSQLNLQLHGRGGFCKQRIVGAAATQATNELLVGGAGLSHLKLGVGPDDYVFRVTNASLIDGSLLRRPVEWSDPNDPGTTIFQTGNVSEAQINYDANGPFYLVDANATAPFTGLEEMYFPPGVVIGISTVTPQVQLRVSISFIEHPGPSTPRP